VSGTVRDRELMTGEASMDAARRTAVRFMTRAATCICLREQVCPLKPGRQPAWLRRSRKPLDLMGPATVYINQAGAYQLPSPSDRAVADRYAAEEES
jgi:hypothetical protein